MPGLGQVVVCDNVVAPRRGAWIETAMARYAGSKNSVAPRRGAWIETGDEVGAGLDGQRRTPQGTWIETPRSPGRPLRCAVAPCRSPCVSVVAGVYTGF